MIVGNPIIMILKAILNWFRLRRNYIANAVDKIPPEIKDALVAWYSPYCKQRMTNYDVIESYADDFTKWRIDKAANNYICKINKFLQIIEEENGLIDIETLLGKSIDNLIISPVQEYPDMLKGVTIGNGKIRIGLPGINKDIVLDANDIETFKQSLVK